MPTDVGIGVETTPPRYFNPNPITPTKLYGLPRSAVIYPKRLILLQDCRLIRYLWM